MRGNGEDRTSDQAGSRPLSETERATNPADLSETILLEDKELMRRVDECHSGDYVREDHPDRCPVCGNIEPGSLSCRHCGHRIKRKGKTPCFCFQEAVDTLEHQPTLESLVSGAAREEDGGVHVWVTVVLAAATDGPSEAAPVEVRTRGTPAGELLGHTAKNETASLQKALKRIYSADAKALACRALLQGGIRREDGSRSAYTVRLLLPIEKDLTKAITAALNTAHR